MQSVSIVGCGYTGLRLAARWLALGVAVRGFATCPASVRQIADSGATAQTLDLDADPGDQNIPDFDGQLVYYAVPPAPTGTGDPRLERFLARLMGTPRRIVYLSTTGVYGDRAGAVVDEETAVAPQSARAVRRVAAELALRDWAGARDVSWCILRVAGIYGPGRLPLERLRRAEPAIDPAEASPGNRIHVEDLVTACIAAGRSARAHRGIFNITDGTDDSITGYLLRVARLSGLPAPPFVSRAVAARDSSPAAWSFLGESRRADNRRMREELGVALAYHDLDEGIRASL
jgi:nucleoside-diphosphate-sugar epimerase